ncbi:RND family efflux transporter MFP subunit [Bacteroides reticulotermitis]|uniref:Co/Zn/Cd efflux system membrane fusion protein n=3 Tax=Bacteroides reticulotermitis TaxID=1133319 RepID=W4UNF6_9BACE|nr:RND family efflux transporter MFP subunit [Bacteroides reticulotermitis]GAE82049.1 Co/Zn/Cd efflux system membrane fusion protein [Bacteroides reticulotermitis JCM 10512]
MMKHKFTWLLLSVALSLVVACSGKKSDADKKELGVSTVLPDGDNRVSAQILKRCDFHHELISNGKVNARSKADLRFETGEVIARIYVKNGDRVRKGQKLAELDQFRLEQKMAQAEDALAKASLELQDVLIGQGYTSDDFSKVPAETMKLAKVKSGYDQTKSQYELIKRELEHATLVAPFDGIVANLFAKPHNPANTSEVFCTVIDTRGMEADFTVLESELSFIKMGDKVSVTPYAGGDSYEGSVSEVNPLVDVNGMVKVKAAVNGQDKLFSGMNVRVSVRRSLGGQLVIPKTAVVLRSGKQVVFTLSNDKAMWNYVHTGLENATEYVVSDKSQKGIADGLLEGDTVIITGNLNLAHEAEVQATMHAE